MGDQLSIDWSAKAPERKVYTVSDLTARIRELLEGEFGEVWVQGEVSNFKAAPSGHVYFTLKDQGAQLRAVLFKSALRLLKFQPKDGLSVTARGRISVYDPRGEYQLIVDFLEPAGYGALQLAFQQLKAKLAGEGLFDAERKKPLPLLPRRIGLITSPRGAVIADMLRILHRRFENLDIVLYPVKVQGEGAAEEIVRALRYFSRPPERQIGGPADVLIVARGGGSIEDLWAFNEEKVARAIADSKVPVISAVGHETDFTIADFVADLRAPTPSAAAELVVQTKAQLAERIGTLQQSLEERLAYRLLGLRHRLGELARHRAFESVARLVRVRIQHTDEMTYRLMDAARRQLSAILRRLESVPNRLARLNIGRRLETDRRRQTAALTALQHALRRAMDRRASRLDSLRSQLLNLSPLSVLERGYALAYGPEGRLLRDAAQVAAGDSIDVRLAKGRLCARVTKTKP
jgi:exodeoxyribonuclease VII large subunit